MRLGLLLVFLTCFLNNPLFSQIDITGVIKSKNSGTALSYVHIYSTSTNKHAVTVQNGRFRITIPKPIDTKDTLTFSHVGFKELSKGIFLDTSKVEVEIFLEQSEVILNELVVTPGKNPANRIIENAVKNRNLNDPRKLPRYSLLSYQKFKWGALTRKDSLKVFNDTINKSRKSVDSTELKDGRSFYTTKSPKADSFYLMLLEQVSREYYLKPNKKRRTILASRTSGLQESKIYLKFSDIQPFGFYTDYIKLRDAEVLNPISKNSFRKYNFLLSDQFISDQGDTVSVVKFNPKPNKVFEGFRGVLYIDHSDFAVVKLLVEYLSVDNFYYRVYEKFQPKHDTWFPVFMETNIIPPASLFDDPQAIFTARSSMLEMEVDDSLVKRNIPDNNVKFLEFTNKKSDSIIRKLRTDSLTFKEQYTYELVDSFGREHSFDSKLEWIRAFRKGNIKTGPISWPINGIIGYNRFEGFRVGAKFKTNDDFSSTYVLGGHFRYGFGDNSLKYGGNLQVTLEQPIDFNINLFANKELQESGTIDFYGDNEKNKFGDFSKYFRNDYYDIYNAGIRFEFRALKNLRSNLSLSHEILNHSKYGLSGSNNHQKNSKFELRNTTLSIKLRYAGNEELIEYNGTVRSGGFKYPVIYLNYTRGISGIFNSDLTYHKVALKFAESFRLRHVGRSYITLLGGMGVGKVPFYKMFYLPGGDAGDQYPIKIANSFNTIPIQEYLTNKFMMFELRQEIDDILIKNKWMRPFLAMELRGAFGKYDNEKIYSNSDLTEFNGSLFEVGVAIEDLLYYSPKSKTYSSSLGIGGYYKFGEYNEGKLSQDFAVKVVVNFDSKILKGL